MRVSTLVSAAACVQLSIAGYVLEDDYMTDFFANFDFFTGPDPTDGFVQYVDKATAQRSSLINTTSSTAQWGVDATNKTPQGRPSVRISSKKAYDNGLIVLDVAHMPFGCGTWPAFWTLGPHWPNGGEIDIIEGVNDATTNAMTLHTSPGCSIGHDTHIFSGSVTTSNCDVKAQGQAQNAGCSIQDTSTQSYGAGLNQDGGAVFAMEWNSDGISIYRFARNAVPADALGDSPNPSAWGKPAARFAGACDIDKKFAAQQIVFDTTFCGQWAGDGNVWGKSSCGKKAATCEEWVRNNPHAFTEAYWEINALKVYQTNGQPATPPSAQPLPASSAAPKSSSYPAAAAPSAPAAPPAVHPIPSSTPGVVTSTPAATPVVPVPSPPAAVPAIGASPAAPSPDAQVTPVIGKPVIDRPSDNVNAVPAAAPMGQFGLPGFNWPQGSGSGGGSGSNDAPANDDAPSSAASPPPPPPSPATPAPPQNTTPPPTVPAPQQNAPLPPPPDPVVTIVETIYETVYARAAPTAAPPNHARHARHVRDHRRRITHHHAAARR
ncbi:hypothetical protein ACEQ8H_000669 [Pleosporales sp. CAS-2024a]